MLDIAVAGEFHGLGNVHRRTRIVRRVRQQPFLAAADVHAVAGEVHDQLLDAGASRDGFDGGEDLVGRHLSGTVGDQLRLRAIDHSLLQSPSMHPLCTFGGIVQALQPTRLIDPDEDSPAPHFDLAESFQFCGPS